MYRSLKLSPREDNECAISQAFSCCSVVFGVYVCLCAHVSARTGGGGNQAACLCFHHECVCLGWMGGLGEALGDLGSTEWPLLGHYYQWDFNIIAENTPSTLQHIL